MISNPVPTSPFFHYFIGPCAFYNNIYLPDADPRSENAITWHHFCMIAVPTMHLGFDKIYSVEKWNKTRVWKSGPKNKYDRRIIHISEAVLYGWHKNDPTFCSQATRGYCIIDSSHVIEGPRSVQAVGQVEGPLYIKLAIKETRGSVKGEWRKTEGKKKKRNGSGKSFKVGDEGGGLKNVFRTMLCWRQKDRWQKICTNFINKTNILKEKS